MSKFAKFVAIVVAVSVVSLSNVGNAAAEGTCSYSGCPALYIVLTSIPAVGGTTTGITTTIVLVAGGDEMEAYLRSNAVALQEDITLGGGQVAHDLAAAFQVPKEHMTTFARMLHENRDQLLPLTDQTLLNAERAGRFTQLIVDSMLADPYLATELVVKLSTS